MGQSRAHAQGASHLSQWAAGPWTAAQSTCQIPPPTTWTSACPSVDKRATPAKSPRVKWFSVCAELYVLAHEGMGSGVKSFTMLLLFLLQKHLWSTL